MLRLVVLASLLAIAEPAAARPPPPDIAYDPPATITLVEWTTWLRGGIVVGGGDPETAPSGGVIRAATPIESDRNVAGAAGIGLTLPAGRHARIGAWAELRSWGLPVIGGELTVIPGDLDLFFYKGKSAITARAGGSPEVLTAQLGLSYRAPWDLHGTQPRGSRYIIGTGLVATFTQNRDDPKDWSATVGIELEPLGALRYIFGVRSWY